MDLNLENATELIGKKLEIWYELLVKNIPNFAVALLVLIVFVLLAKVTRNLVNRILKKSISNRALENLISSTSYLVVIFVGLFIALGILHLDKTVTSILAGAGVIGLALGFAFQEIASNFVSGIFIAVKKPYKTGDIVEVVDYLGEVTSINLRTTTITTFDGIEVYIPNKSMFTEPLKNFTSTPKRRLDISVGVSYSDDLEKVEKVTKEVVESVEGRIKDKPVEIFFKEFGGSSINLDARVWIEYPAQKNYLRTRHEAIMKIKKAYDENGISIPFPIRTLDINTDALKEIFSSKDA